MWFSKKARAAAVPPTGPTPPPEPAPAATPTDAARLLAAVRESATATEQDADSASNTSSMVAANVQMVAGMMGEMTTRMTEVKDKVGGARQFV
ncbi:MAG: hypothetical protein JNN13_19050, partial [Planctomycetes bacterium]|nr:hypothetical protein [Planctomycetota bacterium]